MCVRVCVCVCVCLCVSLQSPKAPDANTDMGEHTIRYAIMPHAAG